MKHQLSYGLRISLGCAPTCGPMTPRSSSRSIRRATWLKPILLSSVGERKERTVSAIADDKFIMSAGFDDPTALKVADHRCMADGREPVRDDDRGASVRKTAQRILNRSLCECVKGACSLVENKDCRIFEEHAGNRDALGLSARKAHPALAYRRVKAIGKRPDGIGEVRAFKRADKTAMVLFPPPDGPTNAQTLPAGITSEGMSSTSLSVPG